MKENAWSLEHLVGGNVDGDLAHITQMIVVDALHPTEVHEPPLPYVPGACAGVNYH